jgi:hypothetical protein
MALGDISFIKGQGGLGRQPEGQDYVSGFLYGGVKPAGYGTDTVRQFYSLKEAEDSGITAADFPALNYQLSEYFRIMENGTVYVAFTGATTTDFTKIKDMQLVADGKIRQVAVFLTDQVFAASLVTGLQGVATELEGEHTPLVILLGADMGGLTLTSLPDLSGLNCPNVAVIISESKSGQGATLAATLGYSMPAVGALLGAVSLASVSENIGWVNKFNVAGTELDELAFSTGNDYKTVTKTQQNDLDAKHYIFLRKLVGLDGSYFSTDHTAATGDYSRIALVRTIDKAIRNVRTALLPFVNSPVVVDRNTGKLTLDTVRSYEAVGQKQLDLMQANGEVSGGLVTIDPNQNVLATDEIKVKIEIVPVGTATSIKVYIGFVSKISGQ